MDAYIIHCSFTGKLSSLTLALYWRPSSSLRMQQLSSVMKMMKRIARGGLMWSPGRWENSQPSSSALTQRKVVICHCVFNNGSQYFPRSWGRSPHHQRRQPVWTPVRTLTQRRHWRASTSCPALTRWTPRRSQEATGTAQTGVSHRSVDNRAEVEFDKQHSTTQIQF